MSKIILVLVILFYPTDVLCQNIFDLIEFQKIEQINKYKGDLNVLDSSKATPLMWAVYKSDLRMVKLLIQKGANVELKGTISFTSKKDGEGYIYGSPLVVAVGENKIDILRYFIEELKVSVEDREFNPTTGLDNGWNSLQWASMIGNKKIIKYLISKGADVNSKTENNGNISESSAIYFSIRNEDFSTTKLLLRLGANINIQDELGATPFDTGIYSKKVGFIKYLYREGARLSSPTCKMNVILLTYNDNIKRLLKVFKIKSTKELPNYYEIN